MRSRCSCGRLCSSVHARTGICAIGSAAFAVAIVASYLTHLSIPFVLDASLVTAYGIALTYAALSVPFIFSGIVVSIALTRFPRQVSALYAADLAGAALGCVIVGPMLQFTDAPTAVLATARRAAAGAWLFATVADVSSAWRPRLPLREAVSQLGAPALPSCSRSRPGRMRVAARHNARGCRLVWVKGQYEPRPLVERWNSFSRVRVIGNPEPMRCGRQGWGLSSTLPADRSRASCISTSTPTPARS